jgi:Asp-tRNA(Asn)/Glu-tRNA(Gln) amidotransferase A subunit family amidase
MSSPRDDLAFLGATALARLVRTRQLSPVDLVELYLARIERLDGRLRAFITVCPEDARRAAREAEEAQARGGAGGPLQGLPFAVKDQFQAKGTRTTVGSRLLEQAMSEDDATVVARLKDAGAILLGKLNLSEFALGGTVSFPFGQPRNPWHPEHQPGGSSGGSGVATAAALAAFTLGEDTGGSIRGPASHCGVVGLRATWGLLSRHGVWCASWSMDVAGPLTRTVEDCALVLGVLAGHDAKDPLTSRRAVPPYRSALTGEVSGLRVGLVRELTHGDGTDPEVRSAVLEAARVLVKLGAVVEEVSLPTLAVAAATFMAICDSEAAGTHQAWLRTRPREYDRATRRRLYTASLLPAALYHQATRARARIREEIRAALARHDVLLSPTMGTPAPPIARETDPVTSKDGAAGRFFGHRSYTTPYSLAGLPALSVPCGFTGSGLPIGLQFGGRAFDEVTLLRAGHAYERATEWHARRPSLG